MASEQMIKMNYEKAIQQANDLMDISRDIKKIADYKLDNSIQVIDRNWNGDNSRKFIQKGRNLKDKIEKSADDISKLSLTIKDMAKAIYNTEMANIQIAKTRSSK